MVGRHRSFTMQVCGTVALLPLLVGTAICLMKYAGWSAVVSRQYGLPKAQEVVSTASHLATAWLWGFVVFAMTSFGVALAVLPRRFENFSPGLRGSIRIMVALIIVAAGTAAIGSLLVTIGHHIR